MRERAGAWRKRVMSSERTTCATNESMHDRTRAGLMRESENVSSVRVCEQRPAGENDDCDNDLEGPTRRVDICVFCASVEQRANESRGVK